MKKFNFILQEFLKILLLFLISFVWTRYFLKKLWLTILVSSIIVVFSYGIMTITNKKKKTKTKLKQKEMENAENSFLSLACQGKTKSIDFFANLANKKHQNIKKNKSYVVIYHEKENVKTVLCFDSSFDGLNITKFMEIYTKIKQENATKIVICCKEVSDKNLQTFLSNFDEKILILNQYDTYEKLYKYYDFYPKITNTYKSDKKLLFKDCLSYSFNKKRTKSYLFSALILIFCSLFVRASLYYCIVSSVLIICAIISQFNKLYNQKITSEILWLWQFYMFEILSCWFFV